jgi:hypothetical protein
MRAGEPSFDNLDICPWRRIFATEDLRFCGRQAFGLED